MLSQSTFMLITFFSFLYSCKSMRKGWFLAVIDGFLCCSNRQVGRLNNSSLALEQLGSDLFLWNFHHSHNCTTPSSHKRILLPAIMPAECTQPFPVLLPFFFLPFLSYSHSVSYPTSSYPQVLPVPPPNQLSPLQIL